MISTILLICCKSTATEIRSFPNPVVDGEPVVKYDQATDTVSMPMWYWREITVYVIEVEESIK